MKKILIAILTGALCSGGVAVASEKAEGSGHGKTHWGYSGETGPAHWGELSEKFAACGEGKNQSPVNIVDAVDKDLAPIAFSYGDVTLRIVNNGHTVQANYGPGSKIEVDGKSYALKQFHFHTPSENNIDSRSFPLEGHLVHAAADGKLAVVGVVFEEGEANPVIEEVWRYMPSLVAEKSVLNEEVNAMDLLPADKDYYGFTGSLTTPPCTEGVKWMVLKKPMTISASQIEKFERVMHHANNRPVQPLHQRTVYE